MANKVIIIIIGLIMLTGQPCGIAIGTDGTRILMTANLPQTTPESRGTVDASTGTSNHTVFTLWTYDAGSAVYGTRQRIIFTG